MVVIPPHNPFRNQSALGWLNSFVHHNDFHLFNILDKTGSLCIKWSQFGVSGSYYNYLNFTWKVINIFNKE